MELQGKQLKFGFFGAEIFDDYAKEKKHRTLNGILYSIIAEQKRVADKYETTFEKLTDDQRSEHVMDIATGEIISIFSAFGDVSRKEASQLLDKELTEGKSLPEIMATLFTELFSSPLYTAIKVKEANPKQPK